MAQRIWLHGCTVSLPFPGLFLTLAHLTPLSVPGTWSGITANQTALAQKVLDDADDIFGTTTYYNEHWILEKNWQEQAFGPNYARLLAIKKKVDPTGVFSCRRCVGSEGGY